MDVAFANDQMRARSGHAAHYLALLKHITLNPMRLGPRRNGGIKARRLIGLPRMPTALNSLAHMIFMRLP
jgi:hypothetical protein